MLLNVNVPVLLDAVSKSKAQAWQTGSGTIIINGSIVSVSGAFEFTTWSSTKGMLHNIQRSSNVRSVRFDIVKA